MIDRGAVVLDGSTSVIGATGEPFVRRGTDAAVRVTTARVDLDGCVGGVVGATGASLAFAVHDGTDAVVVGDGCGVVVSGGDGRVSERTVSFVRWRRAHVAVSRLTHSAPRRRGQRHVRHVRRRRRVW